jgi:hypothetical protein
MNYYSEIKVCIKQIGQANIEFDNNIKDYTFNGKSPEEIAGDYLTKLNEQFETNLLVYIRQGCTVEKITKLVKLSKDTINALKLSGDNHRVSFLLDNKKGMLSDNSTSTHDTINRIISTQKLVLNKVLISLYDKLDDLKSDLVKIPAANEVDEVMNFDETNTSNIPFKSIERATLKLSKKEALMFLFVLEEQQLLEFESIEHRRLFIEKNFNFTETRNNSNHGKSLPMKGVSSELADFNSYTEGTSNNKTLEKLLKKLQDTIHLYQFNTKRGSK